MFWDHRRDKLSFINIMLCSGTGNRPNTYTFTKALAEDMLLKECGNLPVTIVRPSIGKKNSIKFNTNL